MLRTPNDPILQLEGIDQQDFSKLQQVKGTFPFQIGLQQRLPGKTIQQIQSGPVGSIYVFYMVFGRHYTLIDFGSIQIEEVIIPPITLPGLPPIGNTWFDTFSGYFVGMISKLWGAGAWKNSTGVCETIINGIIDPFIVYDTLAPANKDPQDDEQPKALPTPAEDPAAPPQPPTNNAPPQNRTYTDYAISLGFKDMDRYAIDGVGQFDEAPTPCNPAIFSVAFTAISYAAVPSSTVVLEALVISQSFKGCNNLAWSALNYLISNHSGYKCQAIFKLNEMGLDPRSEIFLIGTELRSDGAGGTISTTVTDEVTTYLNTEGEKYNVIPPAGITQSESPAPSFGYERILRNGKLTWTIIRVYDPLPL